MIYANSAWDLDLCGLHAWMQCKETMKHGPSRTHEYGKGVLKQLTQQCAKSGSRVTGSASKQADAAWRITNA